LDLTVPFSYFGRSDMMSNDKKGEDMGQVIQIDDAR